MSFANEKIVKAVRRRHRCDSCCTHIEIGSPAIRWAGMSDGDFYHLIYHTDCRTAEVEFNNDILGWCYGDEWRGLFDLDREDWPWIIEKYPVVAARLGIPRPAQGDRHE